MTEKIFQPDYSHFWNIIGTGCSDYALYDKQLWNDTG